MSKDADLQISLRDSLGTNAGRIFSNSRQLSPRIWNLHSMTWYPQTYGPQRSEAESKSRFQSLQVVLFRSLEKARAFALRLLLATILRQLVGCHMFPSYKRRAETHYNPTSYYQLVEQLTINTGILLPWISCSMRVGIY